MLHALDTTLTDANVTLDSTIADSQLDDTYIESTNTDTNLDDLYETEHYSDDSITNVKQTAQNTVKSKSKKKNSKSKKKKKTARATNEQEKDNATSDISCTDECTNNSDSDSIRCNLCMKWFHTGCVGICDVENVGA